MLERFGSPENLFRAPPADIRAHASESASSELLTHNLDAAKRVLERCAQQKIDVLPLHDAQYPLRVKNIHAPPLVLYCKGLSLPAEEDAALCVVGSRKATRYGLSAVHSIVTELAYSGIVVVSGLAKGIDAAAHQAALRANAPTVAVLGSGVDVCYPAKNRALYEEIAVRGTLVSEYAPGTPPLARHFPARNRIISALSVGVLVVEAPAHSGALITVSHALDQGKDVFAVPGNIDAPHSAGCNRLIREGAQLVTNAADILSEYIALFPHKIRFEHHDGASVESCAARENNAPRDTTRTDAAPARRSGAVSRAPTPAAAAREEPRRTVVDLTAFMRDLSTEEKTVLLCLSGSVRHVDDIAKDTKLPMAHVLRILTMLEIYGKVMSLPGKRFRMAPIE